MSAFVDQGQPLTAEIDMLGAKPKRKNGAPERAAQAAVVAFLRKALPVGSKVAAIKNEHQPRSKGAGARMRFFAARKKEGVVAGMPDLVCLLPPGRAIFIEMKAPKKGKLSPAQETMHGEIRAAGFDVGVARSIDEAALLMQGFGVRLRARP